MSRGPGHLDQSGKGNVMLKSRNPLCLILSHLLFICVLFGQQQSNEFPKLSGPYLGQKPPGTTAEVFAPGVVSTGMFTRDIAVTPDGKEIYFGVVIGQYTFSTIVVTKMVGDRWTEPEVAPFASNPAFKTVEPCISPDGTKFFFSSNRPTAGKDFAESDYDIWVMERTAEGWSQPRNLGSPVNTKAGEYFPSVTNDGTMYLTRTEANGVNNIFRTRWTNGVFSDPQKLPAPVNSSQAQYNAFIAPDESYLIVPMYGRKDSRGSSDYYILFRSPDDSWSEPVNMGDAINSKSGSEYSPYVSRDGKYFFFMSARLNSGLFQSGEQLTYKKLLGLHNRPGTGNPSINWIDARIIDELKTKK
jgi:hypothetical protein